MQNIINEYINKPWYKQFWPWFLISLPASAVVACIATLVIAIQTQDSLVVDDYYKEAMQINRDLSTIEYAAKIGLSASFLIMENNIIQLEMKLKNKEVRLPPVVRLSFNHVTKATKDFSIVLVESPQNNNNVAALYQSQNNNQDFGVLKQGIWYLKLLPMDKEWQLKGVIRNKITNIKLLAE